MYHQSHQQQKHHHQSTQTQHGLVAGVVVSGQSSLTQNALADSIASNVYECSLHGILSTPSSTFIQRAKGMMRCEHPVSYKEMVYKSTVQTAGPSWAENSILPSEIHIRYEKNNLYVRYVGVPQIKDNINAMIRNVVDIKSSETFFIYLDNLGYVKDYEYFVDGYQYSTYNLSLFLVNHRRVLPDGTKGDILNKHSMVELQCLSGEEGFVAAAEYLNTYAEYLYPFVELIKFDHRNLTLDNSNLNYNNR